LLILIGQTAQSCRHDTWQRVYKDCNSEFGYSSLCFGTRPHFPVKGYGQALE